MQAAGRRQATPGGSAEPVVIPIQDVVPTGRIPRATLGLIAVNALVLGAQHLVDAGLPGLFAPFLHASAVHWFINVLYLWLFGDNVEARLGSAGLVGLYVFAGAVGTVATTAWTGLRLPVGGACAVGAVLGAYAVALPRSRILVLVPIPLSLSEVPAAFFLALWAVLHVVSYVAGPAASPTALVPLAAAAGVGALLSWMHQAGGRSRPRW